MSVAPSVPQQAASVTSDRASLGAFAEGQEPIVLAALSHDLALTAPSPAAVVSEYARRVPDEDRVKVAVETVQRAFAGELKGDEPLRRLVEVLYFAGYQQLLAKHSLLYPSYDILSEYFVNANLPSGPLTPRRPIAHGRRWSFLGREIGLPIGVPASVLTSNARWVHYFARNGFNVLTYKTVRSRPRNPNVPPNWVFLPSVRQPLPLDDDDGVPLFAERWDWVEPGRADVSTANSFGVPSPDPDLWEADVEEALHVIHDDQCLIVSVMGDDYDSTGNARVLAEDFAVTAIRAQRAGARIVELNVSCPNSLDNTSRVKPPLCLDEEATYAVIAETRNRLEPDVNLVAKLAYMPAPALEALMARIAPLVDGIAAINTLPRTLRDRRGKPTFPGRDQAGVSGVAIRNHATEFVGNLVRLRTELGTPLEIIGMGGVTDSASFEALFRAGATVVQTASGAFANPLLAWECVDKVGQTLPRLPDLPDSVKETVADALLAALPVGEAVDRFDIAAALSLPAGQTFELLDGLVAKGELHPSGVGRGQAYTRRK